MSAKWSNCIGIEINHDIVYASSTYMYVPMYIPMAIKNNLWWREIILGIDRICNLKSGLFFNPSSEIICHLMLNKTYYRFFLKFLPVLMISQISVLASAPSIFCKSSKNVKEFTKNEEKTLFNFNVEAITQGHFQNPILQISVHHYSLHNIQLFKNMRFVLKLMLRWNTLKFAAFYVLV